MMILVQIPGKMFCMKDNHNNNTLYVPKIFRACEEKATKKPEDKLLSVENGNQKLVCVFRKKAYCF